MISDSDPACPFPFFFFFSFFALLFGKKWGPNNVGGISLKSGNRLDSKRFANIKDFIMGREG